MRMRILVLLVIAAMSAASAQDKDKKMSGMGHDKDMKASKDMKGGKMPMMASKQSPEMAKLEKMLAGTWSIDVKSEPMMGMPADTGKGTDVVKRGPGGNSLTSDVRSTSAMGPFTGHGVYWYDATAGGYKAVWCDTETPSGCALNGIGKWQGDDLVFEFDSAMPPNMGGGKMHMKETFSDVKPASFTFSIDGGPSADKMQHMMTIRYKKAGGSATAATKK